MTADVNKDINSKRLPTLFITHGGGPCFFIETNGIWDKMGDWLKNLGSSIGSKPKAIIVVSGHWEEKDVTVMTSTKAPLYYDYSGFPEHTYHLKYDLSGSPELANQVQNLLSEVGIEVKTDSKRGYDHGVFVPFKLIYPDADIPLIELSLKNDLDPVTHIKIGQALLPLRDQGILIVGSGSSFHNGFNSKGTQSSKFFDDWLTQVVSEDKETRDEYLKNWENAPSARLSHSREEHLIPLMVAAGAAGEDLGKRIFSDNIMGVTLSSFQFG